MIPDGPSDQAYFFAFEIHTGYPLIFYCFRDTKRVCHLSFFPKFCIHNWLKKLDGNCLDHCDPCQALEEELPLPHSSIRGSPPSAICYYKYLIVKTYFQLVDVSEAGNVFYRAPLRCHVPD